MCPRIAEIKILLGLLQGFPAAVNATVTYTLTPDNELEAVLKATSDGATPINMAQHSYFNLDGGVSGSSVLGHTVEMPNACDPPKESPSKPSRPAACTGSTAHTRP